MAPEEGKTGRPYVWILLHIFAISRKSSYSKWLRRRFWRRGACRNLPDSLLPLGSTVSEKEKAPLPFFRFVFWSDPVHVAFCD